MTEKSRSFVESSVTRTTVTSSAVINRGWVLTSAQSASEPFRVVAAVWGVLSSVWTHVAAKMRAVQFSAGAPDLEYSIFVYLTYPHPQEILGVKN